MRVSFLAAGVERPARRRKRRVSHERKRRETEKKTERPVDEHQCPKPRGILPVSSTLPPSAGEEERGREERGLRPRLPAATNVHEGLLAAADWAIGIAIKMPDGTDGTDGGPSGRCGATVSHRAAGGPDLTYLRATEPPHPQDLSESDGWKIATSRRHGNPILHGQTLYLGGEEGPNGRIYCVPGHASRVLCVDTATDDVYPVGPVFDGDNCVLGGRFKWLRGITVGDVIYGLPCHADTVLRIDTTTDEVGTLRIPYEEYFDDEREGGGSGGEEEAAETAASRERNTPWKYHGGCVSPHDGAIYAIPQTVSLISFHRL